MSLYVCAKCFRERPEQPHILLADTCLVPHQPNPQWLVADALPNLGGRLQEEPLGEAGTQLVCPEPCGSLVAMLVGAAPEGDLFHGLAHKYVFFAQELVLVNTPVRDMLPSWAPRDQNWWAAVSASGHAAFTAGGALAAMARYVTEMQSHTSEVAQATAASTAALSACDASALASAGDSAARAAKAAARTMAVVQQVDAAVLRVVDAAAPAERALAPLMALDSAVCTSSELRDLRVALGRLPQLVQGFAWVSSEYRDAVARVTVDAAASAASAGAAAALRAENQMLRAENETLRAALRESRAVQLAGADELVTALVAGVKRKVRECVEGGFL